MLLLMALLFMCVNGAQNCSINDHSPILPKYTYRWSITVGDFPSSPLGLCEISVNKSSSAFQVCGIIELLSAVVPSNQRIFCITHS